MTDKEALPQPPEPPYQCKTDAEKIAYAFGWFKALELNPRPKREPLTDEEIRKARHHMVDGAYQYSFMQGVRYAEAAHGIEADQC